MDKTLNGLTERVISFYPSIGRDKYNSWRVLPEEERKKFRPPFRKLSTRTLSLAEVADYISSPLTKPETRYNEKTLSALTDELRNSEDYKIKKTFLLDNVVFAGVPELREEERTDKTSGRVYKIKTQRKKANFTDKAIFSGLVVIDLDHLKEQSIDLAELREVVSQDSEIGLRLLFVSPSGDGLKLICKSKRGYSTPKEYEREYFALVNYLSSTLGERYPSFVVDTSGKDVSRTCFLCHDPEVRLFSYDTEFNSDIHPAPKKETPSRTYYSSQSWGDDDGIEELVLRVEESGRDIAPTYKEYFPLVCSFKALGERGRDYLHRVCSLSPKYDPDDTNFDFDNNVPDESQSIGYFVNLCKSNGIDVKLKDYYKGKQIEPISADLRPMNGQDTQFTASTEKEPTTASKMTEESKYSSYLQLPTRESLRELSMKKREGLPTPYVLKKKDGKDEPILLPSGAITMICGRTSHGKSKLLQNLALYTAQQAGEGESVLYLTYEEDSLDVTLQFANIAVGQHLSNYQTSNTEQIRRYFQEGTSGHIPENIKDSRGNIITPKVRETFESNISSFESLLYSGKLRIFHPETTKSGDLVELVEYLSERMKVRAVFVDYVQLLSSGKNGHKDKTADLADVCTDLMGVTTKLDIPFVVASQSNRQAKSPEDISEDNVADAYDLARASNLLLCIWNSYFEKVSEYDDNNEHRKRLEEEGFKLGEGGKLYIKASKNRGGTPNIDGVFDFDGETGKILSNDDLPEGEPEPIRYTPKVKY